MSHQAVEALRGAFEEFARGEFGAVDGLPDDIELTTAPEMPDAGVYRGEAARLWLKSWVESFERLTLEPVEFLDAGNQVVAGFTQRGTPRGGRSQVELPTWAVYTMRGDLSISRMELFMKRSEALRTAGLPD